MSMDCRIGTLHADGARHVHWCDAHGASATDATGGPLARCHHDRLTATDPDWQDVLTIGLGEYPAGIEARCLIPPVYDTTIMDQDRLRGVHVHARRRPGEHLDVHATFRALRIETRHGSGRRFVEIGYRSFLHHVVSDTFGLTPKYLECPTCLTPHTDTGIWAVTPRRERICEGCGAEFHDVEHAVANPCVLARTVLMATLDRPLAPPARGVEVEQSAYANGVQFWGPEAAVVNSSPEIETGGMHTHLYDERWDPQYPAVEDNFSVITVDGVAFDPEMMRLFMAQRAVPELRHALRVFACAHCGAAHFDQGRSGCVPHIRHRCHACGEAFTAEGETGPVIGNPLMADLDRAAATGVAPLKSRFWA